MLAHNIKAILTLVPEAKPMVKAASLEEDFPYDSKDSVTASYLRVHYLEKVAEKRVDPATVAKITKAAQLHGVKDALDAFLPRFNTLEKVASQNQSKYGLKLKEIEAGFEGDLSGFGFIGIEKTAAMAESIVDAYGDEVQSSELLRYAGRAYLNKEAAVIALANRYHASKDASFVKIARVVADSISETDFSTINELCQTVTQLDKQAGLDIIGFNFYKEALFTKKAALTSSMMVKLAGKDVPWESIQKFGMERIASTIGSDVAGAMTGDPGSDKAMLESLPLDVQTMLGSLVRGC